MSTLHEKLSYDQLFRLSDPRRVLRSLTVKGPPMEMDSYQDVMYYSFNFKSNPSTTGLRHRGYIKFLKPINSRKTPLSKLNVEVDCTCFSGDAPVLMADGTYKPISEIRPGDSVYTHKGRIRPVIGNVARNTNPSEKVYELKLSGFPVPVIATENHPFFAFRPNLVCACGCGKVLREMRGSANPARALARTYIKGHCHTTVLSNSVIEAVKDELRAGSRCTDIVTKVGVSKGSVYNISHGIVDVKTEVEKPKEEFSKVRVADFGSNEWFLSPWLEEGSGSIDPRLARFLGYYAAEGSIPDRNDVRFTLHTSERNTIGRDLIEIAESFFASGFWFRKPRKRVGSTGSIWRVDEYSKPTHKRQQKCFGLEFHILPSFKSYLKEHVGCGARCKALSEYLMSLNNETLRELLVGLFLGDGTFVSSGNFRWTSVSKKLVWNVSTILRRLRIDHVITNCGESLGVDIRNGDSVRKVFDWLKPYLRITTLARRSSKRGRVDYHRKDGALKVLKSAKVIDFKDQVWDLCVEEDHSFIVAGVAVANCPDYKFRWSWANKQRQAGHVGPQSLNQALNRAPRKTNPGGAPGLCKHLLATRQYIYGLIATFPGDEPDTSEKLNKLTKYATKRWINYDQEVQKAKERDAIIAQNKALRNIGVPPDKRGRQISYGSTKLPEPLPGDESPKNKKNIRGDNDNPLNPKNESVYIITKMKTPFNESQMKHLKTARAIIVEMEDDLKGIEGDDSELDGLDGVDEMPPPGGADMPMEPEVSDSAVGASTEDNVALGLLREIRDLLQQMVGEEGVEDLETPDMPEDEGEEGTEEDNLGEPPAGEEDEDVRPGGGARPIETGV